MLLTCTHFTFFIFLFKINNSCSIVILRHNFYTVPNTIKHLSCQCTIFSFPVDNSRSPVLSAILRQLLPPGGHILTYGRQDFDSALEQIIISRRRHNLFVLKFYRFVSYEVKQHVKLFSRWSS
jgi:hypothetical protein